MEDDEFAPVKANLIAALPAKLRKETRDAFANKIGFMNQFSLRTRLRRLARDCRDIVAPLIPADSAGREAFVNLVADTRNFFTHYSEELERKAARGRHLLR